MSTYEAAHHQVRRARGRAADHNCARCGAPALHWAYDGADVAEVVDEQGRRYSELIEHYVPMCGSCHTRFDHSPQWLGRRARLANAARQAAMTDEERSAAARKASQSATGPVVRARQLAKGWATASEDDRREIRRVLREAGIIR